MNNERLITSESVTEGHPDKVCDLVADNILDAALKGDPYSRIACEVTAATGLILVVGEFTTETYIDIPKIVRRVVTDIGYVGSDMGFDGATCAVMTSINEQSKDIAQGVDRTDSADSADSLGAGDQGMMYGYACNDTPELMPLPIMLAHGLTARLTEVRKSGEIKYLRPDGKAQVTVAYNKKGVPKYVDTVVVSCQHSDIIEHERIVKDITAKVIKKIIPSKYLKADAKIYINPTGRFVIGGPAGDCGVTGRKIIVDTYGGICPHGGGAFSGKDPTKVDRSAAYFSRYVCKNLVAAGVADRIMLQVAYAIGRADPVSIYIDTFGTAKYPEDKILDAVKKCFDFRPFKIIEKLELRKPIYAKTTNYGHLGKADMTWERVDMVNKLKGVLCE